MSTSPPTGFFLANPWYESLAVTVVSGGAGLALPYLTSVVGPGWEAGVTVGSIVLGVAHTVACQYRGNQPQTLAKSKTEQKSDGKSSAKETSSEKTADLTVESDETIIVKPPQKTSQKTKKPTKVVWTQRVIHIATTDTLADYWERAIIKGGEKTNVDPGKQHPYGLTFSRLLPRTTIQQKKEKFEPLTAETTFSIGKHTVCASRSNGEKVKTTVVVGAKKLTLEFSPKPGSHGYGGTLAALTKIGAGSVCPMDSGVLAPLVTYWKKSEGETDFQVIASDWVPSVIGSPHCIQAQRDSHDDAYAPSDWVEIELTIVRSPQVITCASTISVWGDSFGTDQDIRLRDAFQCKGAKGTLVFKDELGIVVPGVTLLPFGFDKKYSVFAEETDDYEESNEVKCTIHVLYSAIKWMQVLEYTDTSTYSNCRMYPCNMTYLHKKVPINLHFTTFKVFSSSLKLMPLTAAEIFTALFESGHHCTYELYDPGDASNPRHCEETPLESHTEIGFACINWMKEKLTEERQRIWVLIRDSPMVRKQSK